LRAFRPAEPISRQFRERPGGSAAEKCDEVAPFHCPVPPVLPNERNSTPRHCCAAGFQVAYAVGQKAPKAFGALVGRFPQYSKSGRCRIPSSGSGRGVCQPRAPSSVNRVNRVNSIFSGCAAGGPSRGCPRDAFWSTEGRVAIEALFGYLVGGGKRARWHVQAKRRKATPLSGTIE
jgi:hypothetical protein